MQNVRFTPALGLMVVALVFGAVSVAEGQSSPTFFVSDAVVAEGDAGVSTATFTVTLLNPNNVVSRVTFVTSDGSASGSSTRSSNTALGIPVIGLASAYPATLDVSGFSGTIQHVAVRLDQLTHSFPADLDILLVGPGGQKVLFMSDIGGSADVFNVSPTFQDGGLPQPLPLATATFAPTDFDPGSTGEMPAPAPPGPYGTELAVFNGTNPNGTWSLYMRDDQSADGGSIAGFSLIITTTGDGHDYVPAAGLLTFTPGTPARTFQVPIKGDSMLEGDETFGVNLFATFNAVVGDAQGVGTILNDEGVTTAQPPSNLRVSSIVGNQVTLRWSPPLVGPAPTNYLLEGGTTPGSVLASIPSGSATSILTLPVPTGSFYLRLHTVAGASKSLASNEVLVHVQVPTPPSPPVNLLGTVATSRLGLTWHNTFEGGAPTAIVLDVTGALSTSIPLPVSGSFSYPTVPPGTYTFRVRAVNAAGASASSNPVTLTFPGGCGGVLQPPSNFLAYRTGSVITVVWDSPTIGPAPTGYILDVTGSFAGSLTTTAHTISGTVGSGTYVLRARAMNHCGAGTATEPQTVVVP